MIFELLKETNVYKIIIKVVSFFLQRVRAQNLYCFIEKGKAISENQ